jgi:hypothetical protein
VTERTAVLVTGSRDWSEPEPMRARLSLYPSGTILLHGACGKWKTVNGRRLLFGADLWADLIGRKEFGHVPWPLAYFDDLGLAGGPVRNAALVAHLLVFHRFRFRCAVEAFPLGIAKGTTDCVKKVRTEFMAANSPIVIRGMEGRDV